MDFKRTEELVQVNERKGLYKSDVEAMLSTYMENRGGFRKAAEKKNIRGAAAPSIKAVTELLATIKGPQLTDDDVIRLINCFTIDKKVNPKKESFKVLVKMLEQGFPHLNHRTIANQLIKLNSEQQKIVLEGAGISPTLAQIKQEYLENGDPKGITDYAGSFGQKLASVKTKDGELRDFLDGLKINLKDTLSKWNHERQELRLDMLRDQKILLEQQYVDGTINKDALMQFNQTLRTMIEGDFKFTPSLLKSLDKQREKVAEDRKQAVYDGELMKIVEEFTADEKGSGVNYDLIKAVNALVSSLKQKEQLPNGIKPIDLNKNLFDQIKPIFDRMKKILEEHAPTSKEELAEMKRAASALEGLLPLLAMQKGFEGLQLTTAQNNYLSHFEVKLQTKIQDKPLSKPSSEGTLSARMLSSRTGVAETEVAKKDAVDSAKDHSGMSKKK